jgi:hypothetical protein
MNRLTVSLFAAAALLGATSPSARADVAALSLRTGGFAISVSAQDSDSADEPEPAQVEPKATIEPSPIAMDADPDARAFVPDVYPSRPAAARAAALQWSRSDPRRWKTPPTRVRVMSDDQSLFTPIQEGIRARWPTLRVEPCDGTLCGNGSAPSNEAWLYVTLPKGAVALRCAGWSDSAASADYVDKPWVANFADYVGRAPGRWVVTHSDFDSPAVTAADAAREARAAAVDEVVPLVVGRMRDAAKFSRDGIRRAVEAQLLGHRLVTDRFPQKFERPYGTLYRETVLIDASDPQVDALARDVRRSLQAERTARLGGLAGAGAVLLVTYALYRFANAFTRGYFTWSLRTAAAVVAAGAVVLIVAVA